MKNSEQPAFPTDETRYDSMLELNATEYKQFVGLTKREYFAAMAMQGIMSQSHIQHGDEDNWVEMGHGWGEDACNSLNKKEKYVAYSIAQFSIEIADALLEELEKPTKS